MDPRDLFPQIFRDRHTRVACSLQSSPAAWLNSSDVRRFASFSARDWMESRALLPNRSGSPSATFLQHLAARAHHHIARSQPQSPMSPVFSVTSPQSRRPVVATRRFLLRQPRPRQRQLLFSPCQKPPDNMLLRARSRARSRLSSHLCALVPSAVIPVTSISSTARQRPPPPKLNHRQTRACAALTPEPNDRWHHPRSPAPPPSLLNRCPGSALHRFFPVFAPPQLSLSSARV